MRMFPVCTRLDYGLSHLFGLSVFDLLRQALIVRLLFFFAVFFFFLLLRFLFFLLFWYSVYVSMVSGSDLRNAGLGHLRRRPAEPLQALP